MSFVYKHKNVKQVKIRRSNRSLSRTLRTKRNIPNQTHLSASLKRKLFRKKILKNIFFEHLIFLKYSLILISQKNNSTIRCLKNIQYGTNMLLLFRKLTLLPMKIFKIAFWLF